MCIALPAGMADQALLNLFDMFCFNSHWSLKMFDTFMGMVALLMLAGVVCTVMSGDFLVLLLVGFVIYAIFHVARGFS